MAIPESGADTARFNEMTTRERELYLKLIVFREAERQDARKSSFFSEFLSGEEIDQEFATETPTEFIIMYRSLSNSDRTQLEKDLDGGFEALQARLVAASREALRRPFIAK